MTIPYREDTEYYLNLKVYQRVGEAGLEFFKYSVLSIT